MSNSLNLTNIKTLLATAYLAGVHDAFEKSKGLDTFSLQKNIEDAIEFRETFINELKDAGIGNTNSILINAKEKSKELFCKKYPDEMKCKATPPTNKKEETGILTSLSSFFTSPKTANTSTTTTTTTNTNTATNTATNTTPKTNTNTNTSLPSTNTNTNTSLPSTNITANTALPSTNLPRTNVPILPPLVSTNVYVPPPSASTNVPKLNASALNPMVQTATIGGKRKSR
jgi:hypothetical protein